MTAPRFAIDAGARPRGVVWDITYACPLRCGHCYSESGRRPTRQLDGRELARVVDALVAWNPGTVVLSGGEPLVVPEIFEVAGRLRAGGVSVHLYTGGWYLPASSLDQVLDLMNNVTVSVDGATPATHDRLRGRDGSFARAIDAVRRLSEAGWRRLERGRPAPAVGVDYTVTRTNFDEMADLCRLLAERAPRLDYLFFGAVMPIGLASRKSFVEAEIPTRRQLRCLRDAGFGSEIRASAHADLDVCVSDNAMFQMRPERLAGGEIPAVQVEPDGQVRAMPVYEGTVGSLLTEPGPVLWQRVVARWNDPWVQRVISGAASMSQWAAATRELDLRFGSPDDRARIRRRPAYPPTPPRHRPDAVLADP